MKTKEPGEGKIRNEDRFDECPTCGCMHFLKYKCDPSDKQTIIDNPFYDFSDREKEDWS